MRTRSTASAARTAGSPSSTRARPPLHGRGRVHRRGPGPRAGALSAPWSENVDPATGRLLPAGELRARLAALGIDAGTRVVASCGSGVTACHDLLALRIAGVGDTALYTGSWSGWSSDPARPVAVGEAGAIR